MYKYTAQGDFKMKVKETFANEDGTQAGSRREGERCYQGIECQSNFCFQGRCTLVKENGSCINDTQCESNKCDNGICVRNPNQVPPEKRKTGQDCTRNYQCESNNCNRSNGTCV